MQIEFIVVSPVTASVIQYVPIISNAMFLFFLLSCNHQSKRSKIVILRDLFFCIIASIPFYTNNTIQLYTNYKNQIIEIQSCDFSLAALNRFSSNIQFRIIDVKLLNVT